MPVANNTSNYISNFKSEAYQWQDLASGSKPETETSLFCAFVQFNAVYSYEPVSANYKEGVFFFHRPQTSFYMLTRPFFPNGRVKVPCNGMCVGGPQAP